MAYHSCIVCRINSPYSSVGLGAAKRTHVTPRLGVISVCREHRKTMFCGVCLREAPAAECDPQFDIQGTMRLGGYNHLYGHDNFNLAMSGYNPYTTALNPALMVLCSENEDEETWPGVDATCRSCRTEGLWSRIKSSARDREAVGGPRFVQSSSTLSRSSPTNPRNLTLARVPPWKYASADWETRQTVDAFIELGEGSIAEVLNVAREKLWLRSYTKMPELMEQAVAATRWASEGMATDFSQNTVAYHHRETEAVAAPHQTHTRTTEGGDSYSPVNSVSPRRSRSPSPRSAYSSDYEGSEDEDDPDLLSMTEDAGGVRDLAISDWARTRILDGHWCSPADQWYGYARPIGGGVRDPSEDTDYESETDDDEFDGSGGSRRSIRISAIHPCPWTLSRPPSPSSHSSPDDLHPRLSTVRSQAPPSFGLCEQAFRAFSKQLRQILLPAMNNIIRRLVIESANGIGGAWGDPAVRAAKLSLEDVLAELRTPGVWFDGVDWAAGGLDLGRKREEDSLSSTSASTRSDGSHTTSPVLSTTTLHTTPSPPPSHGEEKDQETETSRPKPPQVIIPIPVSPVLESPKLLHPIPYVPATLAHMAQYSLEAFKQVNITLPTLWM